MGLVDKEGLGSAASGGIARGARHTADAEHDLLSRARVLIARVQVPIDPGVVFRFSAVDLQRMQRHLADLTSPHASSTPFVQGMAHRA